MDCVDGEFCHEPCPECLFEAGSWDGRWIVCKVFAPSYDTGSEEEALFSLICKAVNTSNVATDDIQQITLKK